METDGWHHFHVSTIMHPNWPRGWEKSRIRFISHSALKPQRTPSSPSFQKETESEPREAGGSTVMPSQLMFAQLFTGYQGSSVA